MGKFQNFELNEAQRRLQEIKNKQRAELRAQYWKNVTNPARHATGEGGCVVNNKIICENVIPAHNL